MTFVPRYFEDTSGEDRMQVFVVQGEISFNSLDRILHSACIGYFAEDTRRVWSFDVENVEQLLGEENRGLDSVLPDQSLVLPWSQVAVVGHDGVEVHRGFDRRSSNRRICFDWENWDKVWTMNGDHRRDAEAVSFVVCERNDVSLLNNLEEDLSLF